LDVLAYAYIKKFEESRNDQRAILALKQQFGGEPYKLSRFNTAIRSATFTSPTGKYTYDQHMAKFEDAYNELALLIEPILKPVKVRLFCKSLKEKFMKQTTINAQMSTKMLGDLRSSL
jgi:hypothetical protein